MRLESPPRRWASARRRRHLRHPVSDRWDTQRPLPVISPSGCSAPQNRLRPIRTVCNAAPSACSRRSTPDCSTAAEFHPIDTRRAAGRLHPPPRLLEDVTPPDPGPSGHGSGAPGIAWPRPTADVAIGALCRRTVVPRGSLEPGVPVMPSRRACSASVTTAGTLRSAHVIRREPRHYYSPSAAHCARLDFTIGFTGRSAATTAAQTGLSCSAPLRARWLRPLRRRDRDTCTSEG